MKTFRVVSALLNIKMVKASNRLSCLVDALRSGPYFGNYSMSSGAINDQSPVVDCVVSLKKFYLDDHIINMNLLGDTLVRMVSMFKDMWFCPQRASS